MMAKPMGMIELRPQENVFFPAPYVEDEPAPLVITSQRVIQFVGDRRQELEASTISFVGRSSLRPLIFLGLFFILTGLPLAGYGAYLWYSVRGMPTFEERPPEEENPDFEDPAITRYKAIGLGAAGLVWAALGVLMAKKQRHQVVCRGGRRLMKIVVKNKTEQTQVMMTLQAMLSAAKTMAPPPQQPAPEPAPPAPNKTKVV